MKILIGAIALAFLVGGCATQSQVERKQGRGTRQVYRAGFDPVWRAAVDAAQLGDLEITSADRERGYIASRRGVRMETFGENVGLWVTRLSPTETQVEVVSRQAGPPKFYFKNWEHEIHSAIAANLTREAVGGTGGTGTADGLISGTRTREETRQRIDYLRRQEQQQEDRLAVEEDFARRTELQTEIERLRAERRKLEDYLLGLELEGPP